MAVEKILICNSNCACHSLLTKGIHRTKQKYEIELDLMLKRTKNLLVFGHRSSKYDCDSEEKIDSLHSLKSKGTLYDHSRHRVFKVTISFHPNPKYILNLENLNLFFFSSNSSKVITTKDFKLKYFIFDPLTTGIST